MRRSARVGGGGAQPESRPLAQSRCSPRRSPASRRVQSRRVPDDCRRDLVRDLDVRSGEWSSGRSVPSLADRRDLRRIVRSGRTRGHRLPSPRSPWISVGSSDLGGHRLPSQSPWICLRASDLGGHRLPSRRRHRHLGARRFAHRDSPLRRRRRRRRARKARRRLLARITPAAVSR